MRRSRRSVSADELLEQGGRTRLRLGKFKANEVAVAARRPSDMANTGLERAEVIDGSQTNRQLTIDVQGPRRNHQCAPLAQVFNLDGRIGGHGSREPADDLESHALTTVCHVLPRGISL